MIIKDDDINWIILKELLRMKFSNLCFSNRFHPVLHFARLHLIGGVILWGCMTSAENVSDFQYYQPVSGKKAGVVADPIPFYHEGRYHVFYLLPGGGCDWAHIATSDFITAEDWGIALRSGGKEAVDYSCFTGSVIKSEDGFQIYYTGHNQLFRKSRPGEPYQVILRAHSELELDASGFARFYPVTNGKLEDHQILQRPFRLKPGNRLHLRIMIHGSAVAFEFGRDTTLSARMYDRGDNTFGIFGEDGSVFHRVKAFERVD